MCVGWCARLRGRSMIYPIAALVVMWLLLSRTPIFARMVERRGAPFYGRIASVLTVCAALAVLLHGNLWAALCLFGVSLWLLGRASRAPLKAGRRPANLSQARSATIELVRDPATGRLHGRVLTGPLAGIGLDDLDFARCDALRHRCALGDPAGARLLEAYLDGRFAGWRQAGQGHGDAGERRAERTGLMSEDEAYQVLGLRRGATREDVVRGHRAVMKERHPDRGGTTDLAARANEAKEVLLRQHARYS